MEVLFVIIIIVLAVVTMLAVGVFVQNKALSVKIEELNKGNQHAENVALSMLKTDISQVTKSLESLQKSTNDTVIKSSQNIQNSVQRQLSESSKLVMNVTQKLASLDETNRRVVDVASELKSLQNVLQNPKQRGVFGEYYLESVLENVLAPKQFQMQYKFSNGEIVDAVIFLDKSQVLPVDSKFSLENYNRFLDAENKTDKMLYQKRVRDDLKKRIDETSKYIDPSKNTMDFAFMFIPSESLYYDMLVGKVGSELQARDLIEYAFRDKKVIVVSPTSFMAYLQTVMHGLKSLQIEKQAEQIKGDVIKLGRNISAFDIFMQKIGKSLSVTVGHYNSARKELKKIDKNIIKVTSGEQKMGIEENLLERPSSQD